ncbi:diversity-generating retroelement protein Avd [Scytonema hofmannii FACHB-248]|uniref:Diversity-generating retroelement protein Avd n=1 Tax=Scytonema hofmannii FACHB-248 TaxID=1842502 RepID=A0ABR8GU91_9CYAN|nr:diversity-generating retroelement protein Avd [Scytonema hofmannii FACHB-248]
MQDLPIIQKTYDLIKWYVPILNRLPRKHKFALGDRTIAGLYDLLEGLILARYAQEKLAQLELLNAKLNILRHQTRLLFDFQQTAAQFYKQIASNLALHRDISKCVGAARRRHRLYVDLTAIFKRGKSGLGVRSPLCLSQAIASAPN